MTNIPPRDTPWGPAQTATKIADGIYTVSTASHGGIWLSAERRKDMPAKLKDLTWLGSLQWWEEDCDWAWIALRWPEHFEARAVQSARKSVMWSIENANNDRYTGYAPKRAEAMQSILDQFTKQEA